VTAAKARRELAVDAAVLALAAGAIHVVAAVGHASEWWLHSVFFGLLAAAQLAWGVLVYRGAGARLLAAGAVASFAVILIWALSRTAGLPFGPEAGAAEPVGPLDVLATLDELATVALVLALLRYPRLRPGALRAVARVAPVVGVVLAMLSLLSLTLGGHPHEH
jgi:hypothetical protein